MQANELKEALEPFNGFLKGTRVTHCFNEKCKHSDMFGCKFKDITINEKGQCSLFEEKN